MMRVTDPNRISAAGRAAFSGLLALVFCYLVMFVPLPYYVLQPGTAESVREMVTVGDGGYPESGKLLMTTVGVSRANVLKLAEAELQSYEIRKVDEIRKEGESGEEYDERQHYIMLTSQADAVQAAYRKAGVRYRVAAAGVTVLRTAEGYPAHGILEPGDTLLRVDGGPVLSGAEVSKAMSRKRPGDSVLVEYRRGDRQLEADFTLKELPSAEAGAGAGPGAGKAGAAVGIGITTADMQRIEPELASQRVTIEAGEIGGPSAGLMFALEIYGRLLPGDMTKGYTIAGTGTIGPDGTVGVIGGIRHKVAAAAKAGADLFFAPKDWLPDPGDPAAGEPIPNATEAADEAKKLGTGMKVVPVGSLDEAVAYLAKLPPKPGGG